MKKRIWAILLGCVTAFQLIGEAFQVPLGLEEIKWPEDNPYTAEKAELGRLLYFDKRLSSDGTVSCASCHAIPKAFGDPNALAVGIEGRKGKRHSPSLINMAYTKEFFWDGRASSLEEQCKGPLANINEMALEEDPHVAHLNCEKRISGIGGYRRLFKKVFGHEECTMDDIAQAISTFERTFVSGNSPFDRYVAGDHNALTAEAKHGYDLFVKTDCIQCHSGFNFTEGGYANIGIGMDQDQPDLGRYALDPTNSMWGAFKVPTLREIAFSSPYMHDGSLATLEEVIEHYNQGGIPNRGLDSLVRPLHLSQDDKRDLIAFLYSLSGEGWEHVVEPTQFPD